MIGFSLAVIEGITGEFGTICQKVVPSGRDGFDPQQTAGGSYDGQLLGKIIILVIYQKSEIEIPKVVKDSTAAGEPPGKLSVLLLQKGDSALCPRVLVSADHNRILILPQVKDAGTGLYGVQQVLFCSEIIIGIGAVGFKKIELTDHICMSCSNVVVFIIPGNPTAVNGRKIMVDILQDGVIFMLYKFLFNIEGALCIISDRKK